jgi:type II secretory pathway pseudopilin PulG
MRRFGSDAGFLLVEALVAVALLALAATVIVGVSSDAIRSSARELDETAAWSVMENLALELQRFGKASLRAHAEIVAGPYRVQIVRLDNPGQSSLATHEVSAETAEPRSKRLVLSIYARGL